jgi:hypothetical protein
MASSFISYKENGFWIKDDILCVALGYIYCVMVQIKDQSGWLSDMTQLVKDNSLGYYQSYMHLNFDDILENELKRGIILEILDNAKRFIASREEVLDLKELNALVYDEKAKDIWSGEILKDRILKVVEY